MIHLSTFPKKDGESGRQYAYRLLYKGIMSLELSPGMPLSDKELSQVLQIGRTPIREAIVSLQEAKLVDVYPQRSSCVSRINLDAIDEGVFLRYHTERAVYQEALLLADSPSIGRLTAHLQAQKSCLAHNDVIGFFNYDNAFHKELYMIARKPWTWETVARIVTHHDRVRLLQAQLGVDHLQPAYEDHQTILEAITTRSDRDMSNFLYNHLTTGYRAALPMLIHQFPDYFAL